MKAIGIAHQCRCFRGSPETELTQWKGFLGLWPDWGGPFSRLKKTHQRIRAIGEFAVANRCICFGRSIQTGLGLALLGSVGFGS